MLKHVYGTSIISLYIAHPQKSRIPIGHLEIDVKTCLYIFYKQFLQPAQGRVIFIYKQMLEHVNGILLQFVKIQLRLQVTQLENRPIIESFNEKTNIMDNIMHNVSTQISLRIQRYRIIISETENQLEAKSACPDQRARHAKADPGRYFSKSPHCWFSRGMAQLQFLYTNHIWRFVVL